MIRAVATTESGYFMISIDDIAQQHVRLRLVERDLDLVVVGEPLEAVLEHLRRRAERAALALRRAP